MAKKGVVISKGYDNGVKARNKEARTLRHAKRMENQVEGSKRRLLKRLQAYSVLVSTGDSVQTHRNKLWPYTKHNKVMRPISPHTIIDNR